MKRVSHRTKKEQLAIRSRILILIPSCMLMIIGAVVLMNLAPQGSIEPAPTLAVIATPEAPASASSASTASSFRNLAASTASAVDLNVLSVRNLLIPVSGVNPKQLHDSYNDVRSEGRTHQALDIMAPRATPVLATDDGVVMKLHQSVRGGIMLYESDKSGNFIYYYGHLSGYADGIAEGKEVKRGEVIAYVGDTGNAGPGNYHLHFGISKMTAPGKWSGGEPINPYPLLIHGAETQIGAAGH